MMTEVNAELPGSADADAKVDGINTGTPIPGEIQMPAGKNYYGLAWTAFALAIITWLVPLLTAVPGVMFAQEVLDDPADAPESARKLAYAARLLCYINIALIMTIIILFFLLLGAFLIADLLV